MRRTLARAMTEARSAPVFVSRTPARFGQSVWDAVGMTSCRGLFYDEQVVVAKEVSGVLHISKPESKEDMQLPFGRAAASLPGSEDQWGLSVCCPVADLTRQVQEGTAPVLPPKTDFVKLAVVVLVRDHHGKVLLTKRREHMRTFPRCWVFPGGGVDEGETLTAAARRELQEETGLEVSSDSLKLLCIWESVFPTSSASCLEMGQVKGHAVTVFVEALVEQDNVQNVVLQASECSAYTWVPLGQLINWHSKDKPPPATLAWIMLPGWRIAGETVEPHKISAIQLQGIYPNLLGEGIGQGHLYALAKLAERESRESTARSSSIGCTL